jgi:hypothetical protein
MRKKFINTFCLIWVALILFACAFSGMYQLPPDQKQFVSKEFSIDVPEPFVWVKVSPPNPELVAVDFSVGEHPRDQEAVYSIEWTDWSKHPAMTDAETYERWTKMVPNWLHKDFGTGHYELLFQAPTRFEGKYPALVFVGSGQHNGGKPGSIYAMAVYNGQHMAFMYLLKNLPIVDRDQGLKSIESLRVLPGFKNFERFAYSLTYTGQDGKAK